MDELLTTHWGKNLVFIKKGFISKDEMASMIEKKMTGWKINPLNCLYVRCRWVWKTEEDGSRTHYIIKNNPGKSLNGTFKATIWVKKNA